AAVSSLLERFSPVTFELRSLVAAALSFELRPATVATGRANHGNFSSVLTAIIAVVAAHNVASNAVPTIAVGRVDPAATKIAIAVVGISCTDAVLIARNVHMALVAVPGCGLSDSRSRIARKPSGVAAFPRPSMFAAMFISIAPIAGCSAGTSGNKRR